MNDTTGHCKEMKKPNGCQLHNLQCGYPECDRKPTYHATLKAENAEWKRIADQAHAALAENKGAVYWKERAKAAQSQAAAMAGLLERLRRWDMWPHVADGRYWTGEIDAAIRAAEGEKP